MKIINVLLISAIAGVLPAHAVDMNALNDEARGIAMNFGKTLKHELMQGMKLRMEDLLKRLMQLQYERSEFDFKRGNFRVRGDVVDVYLAYLDFGVRLEILGDTLTDVGFFDPLTTGTNEIPGHSLCD